MHYNAIFLTEQLTNQSRPRTKQTSIEDAINKQVLSQVIRSPPPSPQAADVGPSRIELLESQESITDERLMERLGQDNWTTVEQQDLIQLLVLGGEDKRQLLFNSTAAVQDSPASEEDITMHAAQHGPVDSDSDYEEFTGHSDRDSSSEMEVDVDDADNYVFETPSPHDYNATALAMWNTAAAEWKLQYRETVPDLMDTQGLKTLASKAAETLLHVVQDCENPFVILDHFPDDLIKSWMQPVRLKYCIKHLTAIVAALPPDATKDTLVDWVHQLQQCAEVKILTTTRRVGVYYGPKSQIW